jgi:hypothetical protein
LDQNTDRLREELLGGTIELGVHHQFMVHDPKERLITAPCFRERVLHHAIMNVCGPVFERRLIDDTFACRKGKGRDASLLRTLVFSSRHAFFLKMDIRKYFDSIHHEILLAQLERIFKDERLLALFARIIGVYEVSPGRGLPIGALTSQHMANFYLSWFDRFVKEVLGTRGYVRYMDDCVLWGDSTAELRTKLVRCDEFVTRELGLVIKPEPFINRTSHGFDFLGARVYPSHLELNSRSRVRFRRKLESLDKALKLGRVSEAEAQERASSLVAFARSAGIKSWRFRSRVLVSLG